MQPPEIPSTPPSGKPLHSSTGTKGDFNVKRSELSEIHDASRLHADERPVSPNAGKIKISKTPENERDEPTERIKKDQESVEKEAGLFVAEEKAAEMLAHANPPTMRNTVKNEGKLTQILGWLGLGKSFQETLMNVLENIIQKPVDAVKEETEGAEFGDPMLHLPEKIQNISDKIIDDVLRTQMAVRLPTQILLGGILIYRSNVVNAAEKLLERIKKGELPEYKDKLHKLEEIIHEQKAIIKEEARNMAVENICYIPQALQTVFKDILSHISPAMMAISAGTAMSWVATSAYSLYQAVVDSTKHKAFTKEQNQKSQPIPPTQRLPIATPVEKLLAKRKEAHATSRNQLKKGFFGFLDSLKGFIPGVNHKNVSSDFLKQIPVRNVLLAWKFEVYMDRVKPQASPGEAKDSDWLMKQFDLFKKLNDQGKFVIEEFSPKLKPFPPYDPALSKEENLKIKQAIIIDNVEIENGIAKRELEVGKIQRENGLVVKLSEVERLELEDLENLEKESLEYKKLSASEREKKSAPQLTPKLLNKAINSDVYRIALLDQHAEHQQTLTVENKQAVQALALKKLNSEKKFFKFKVGSSATLFSLSTIAAAGTITLKVLACVGIIAATSMAISIPGLGLFIGGTILVAAGLFFLYKYKPNLFKELLKGTAIALAFNKIPQAYYNYQLNKTKIHRDENTAYVNFLSLRINELQQLDLANPINLTPQMQHLLDNLKKKAADKDRVIDKSDIENLENKLRAKLEDYERERKRIDREIDELEKSLGGYKKRVEELKTELSDRGTQDFLKAANYTSTMTGQHNRVIDVSETIAENITAGNIDNETKKFFKDRMGIDLDEHSHSKDEVKKAMKHFFGLDQEDMKKLIEKLNIRAEIAASKVIAPAA